MITAKEARAQVKALTDHNTASHLTEISNMIKTAASKGLSSVRTNIITSYCCDDVEKKLLESGFTIKKSDGDYAGNKTFQITWY